MDVKKVLHDQLDLSAEDKGYWYILAATEEIERDAMVLTSVMKDLYPAIAQRYNVSVENVESTMRRTVRQLFERGSRAGLEKIVGHTLLEPPTLRHFLARLWYYVSVSSNPEDAAAAELEMASSVLD